MEEQEPLLKSLGFTKEELQARLLDRLAEHFLSVVQIDPEMGEDYRATSPLARKLTEMVKKTVETTIAAMAEKHVLPNVKHYVETLSLQETTKWGEKTGKALTFTEYLVQRAENYMTEQVNYDGKAKRESDSYSWSGTQTRIAHMIHQHLHYSIEQAMKEALKTANSKIVEGIEATVKIKLAEVTKALSIEVKTK